MFQLLQTYFQRSFILVCDDLCVCVCVCMLVFTGEGFSEDLNSGRLVPQAHEHICLSRPAEASCEVERVCVFFFFLSCM